MPPVTRYAPVGELRVAYQVWGQGPMDLAVVWGTMSHIELFWEDPPFARLLDRLGRSLRVMQFDRRGTGLSDRPDRLPALEERMDDLRAVIDEAGCARVALLGESEGGAAAVLFAATYPERVSHLILYGSVARILKADDFPIGGSPAHLAEVIDDVVEHWGTPRTWLPFSPDATAERLRWGARYMRMAGSPKTFRDALTAASQIDIRPILPLLTLPTLVVHKIGDQVVPVAHGRYLAEHIPGATLCELDGRAHYLADDNPDRVVDAIVEFVTGSRPDDDIDRVLATVLFSDIVGSTERAVVLGDRRWRDLLDEHDRVARDIVVRFRGRLIKTTGDGVLATFDGPARAVQAADALVTALRALDVESRVGVHTGELERRGDDVGGLAVHIGARIVAHAAPGQVLVSRTVVDLIAGSQLNFVDAGVHTLKGVPGTWPLFVLVA